AIEQQLQADGRSLFDEENGHDISVQGNGAAVAVQRRYTLTPVFAPSAAGLTDDQVKAMQDLRQFVLSRVMPWDRKVHTLFGVYGEYLRPTGLTPESFGVASGTVSAAAVGDDESED